jgi:hypothetical protein
MKVAICYSGLVRTLPKVYDNHYENLFKHYDCDIYFHLWDSWGYGTVKDKYTSKDDDLTYNEIESLRTLFNPYKYKFEKFREKEKELDDLLKSDNQEFPFCKNVLSMHYKINQCQKLVIDSNIKYDIVLRLRTDHFFTKRIIFKETFKNTIYTSMLPARTNGSDGVNDQIAYGDIISMTKYSSLYDNWNALYKNRPFCNPEFILKEHLINFGVNVEDDINLDHWILDENNNLR